MGFIRPTEYGTYRAYWRDQNGRQHSKSFKTKSLANQHLRHVEGEVARGDYFDAKRGRITLEAWITQCRESSFHLSDSSVEMEGKACDHIFPELGGILLVNLTSDDIERYLAHKLKTLSPSTVNRHFRLLSKWLKQAVEKDRIRKNPCDTITPPQAEEREMRFLTYEELVALAKAMPDRYFAWTLMMGTLGLRFSEANGLLRRSVKLLERKIDIVEQIIRVNGQLVRKKQLKTKGSRRSISIASPLTEILAQHLEEFSLPGPEGIVFPNKLGEPLNSPSFTFNVFKPALRSAGLDPHFRIHDLRHTAVALAIAEGAHPKAIQRRLGHSTIKMTLDRYGHLFPELDENLADRQGASLEVALKGGQVVPFQARRVS